MNNAQWEDGKARCFGLLLDGRAQESGIRRRGSDATLLLICNAHFGPGLAARGFQPFRAMIGASARYAGAIRLDHVLGLGRLYLVPTGCSPRDGAYVQMPLDALLGVTALESQSSRCIIVGEDLGTVPDGFRDSLSEWGVWSYKVMLFEREWDGAFKSSEQYPPQSLVTFNHMICRPIRDGGTVTIFTPNATSVSIRAKAMKSGIRQSPRSTQRLQKERYTIAISLRSSPFWAGQGPACCPFHSTI